MSDINRGDRESQMSDHQLFAQPAGINHVLAEGANSSFLPMGEGGD